MLVDMDIKTAIILAAGKGTRLRSVTGDEFPKPLTPLNGQPIIEYSIQALIGSGVDRILIGCGYLLERFRYLEQKYEEVKIVENPLYDVRASIYTFLIFESLVKEPFYLLEADILYDPDVFKQLNLTEDEKNKILTSSPLDLDDNVYFTSINGRLSKLTKEIKENPEAEGVMTGIWALSAGMIQRFVAYCKDIGIDYSEDYEIMLAKFSLNWEPIHITHIPELSWCEIDNEKHLEYATEEIFPKIKKKFDAIPNNRF